MTGYDFALKIVQGTAELATAYPNVNQSYFAKTCSKRAWCVHFFDRLKFLIKTTLLPFIVLTLALDDPAPAPLFELVWRRRRLTGVVSRGMCPLAADSMLGKFREVVDVLWTPSGTPRAYPNGRSSAAVRGATRERAAAPPPAPRRLSAPTWLCPLPLSDAVLCPVLSLLLYQYTVQCSVL